MNKNFATILTTAALALATGCVTAGTWVNGCYIDGPLCTACDGTKVITHAYGTTICTHCDGTGIEPPAETVIVENNVIVDTWCPGPILPPPRYHHPRHGGYRREPRHRGGGHHAARPARPAGGMRKEGGRPKPTVRAPVGRRTARPAVRPAGGGGRGGRGGGRLR